MWQLLVRVTSALLLVEDRSQPLREEMARSEQLKETMYRMMTRMTDMGFQDAREYQEVMNKYNELTQVINRAARELRLFEDEQVQQQRALTDLMTDYDFAGIAPLKGTLGLPGRRGVVSEGEDVRNLQRFLTVVGFPVTESGRFEGDTRTALQQFQKKYNLFVDGQVGAQTRMLINGMIRGR